MAAEMPVAPSVMEVLVSHWFMAAIMNGQNWLHLAWLQRLHTFSSAADTSGNWALSAFCEGKRSSMRLMKSGTSSATNLDMFMSRSVRIIKNDSLL